MTDVRRMEALEVYQRGLRSPEALTAEERFVYLLLELETYADMEGWDHFFTTPLLRFYGEMQDGLRQAGDTDSLTVLTRYQAFLSARGVPWEPEAIEAFCTDRSPIAYDWYDDYSRCTETRWKRVRAWLKQQGIELRG